MAHDMLHGYGAATFESTKAAGTLSRVAAELTTFVRAEVSSELLRRVLTDQTISLSTRRAIAADLLRASAAPETAALVDFAIRVVRPAELPSGLAHLTAAAESAHRGVDDHPTHGRAALRSRVRGYAERVLEELGNVEEVDAVEEELFGFTRVIDGSPALRRTLADSSCPLAGRLAVLDDLVRAKVRPATFRLLSYVLVAGPVRDLSGMYGWLVELCAEERGRRVARVRAAVELSAEERSELAAALSTLVHRDVEVRVVEDPELVGGVSVAIGDLLIDGTVRLRFERLRDSIAQWA